MHDQAPVPRQAKTQRVRKHGHEKVRVAAEIALPLLVAIAVHVLNPLFANSVGQFGPFSTKLEYIPSQQLAYDRGRAMIQRAAAQKQSHIINTRNTGKNPAQRGLFEDIEHALKTSNIQYTRSIYYETDSDLSNTRWFLEHLGRDPKFRLAVTVHGGEFPSCVITDKEAIFGFNDNSGVLTRALYISGPQTLVDDWREVVRRVIDNPLYSVTVKDFGETIDPPAINDVVERASQRLGILLRQKRGASE